MLKSFQGATGPLKKAEEQSPVNTDTARNNAFTRRVREAFISNGMFQAPNRTDTTSPFRPLDIVPGATLPSGMQSPLLKNGPRPEEKATPPLTPSSTNPSPSF